MNVIAPVENQVSSERVLETVWLLGQPSLENYISFVRRQTVGGEARQKSTLVDEWRAANDYYYELEASEANLADSIDWHDIDPELEPLVDEVSADPRFLETYDLVPTRFAMVELDKLIVSQLHIDLGQRNRLASSLGRDASPEELFRFCQPLNRPEAPIKARRLSRNRYSFSSDSSDLRYREAALVRPGEVAGDTVLRDAEILALIVGYSSNFLSVVQSDNRLVLHNGHHRAYTLRALGYTHAPCVVQTVTRTDELNIVACKEVVEAPAFYFRSPRPPLLKDFFDDRIAKSFYLPPMQRVVEVTVDVREYEVAG